MTKIRPFRAVTYNQEKIRDLSAVMCPPYDVISARKQQYYHDINPYNFIHILLGKDLPGEDKYQRAADYFKNWLKDKILIRDDNPAVYFYNQQYNLKGEKRERLGFIALLNLEQKSSSIFCHEHTRPEPKEDRLKLLDAVKANLSPIFVLFSDRKRIIQRLYQQYIQDKKPFIDIADDEKNIHKLWKLDSKEAQEKLQINMQGANIFIADGHHRYEVACKYREYIREKLGNISGDEDFNYILAYFTNTESHGLTVLPIHRLVKLSYGLDMDNFIENLKDYFDINELKDKARFFFLMEKSGQAEHVLGMYKDKKYRLLTLKNAKIMDKMIADKPKEFKLLDVSILNCIILENILSVNLEDKQSLIFNPDADELIKQVDGNNSYIAFFLNPAKVKQIMSIALLDEKMPTKSTYFYPKVLSGLVINKFD